MSLEDINIHEHKITYYFHFHFHSNPIPHLILRKLARWVSILDTHHFCPSWWATFPGSKQVLWGRLKPRRKPFSGFQWWSLKKWKIFQPFKNISYMNIFLPGIVNADEERWLTSDYWGTSGVETVLASTWKNISNFRSIKGIEA